MGQQLILSQLCGFCYSLINSTLPGLGAVTAQARPQQLPGTLPRMAPACTDVRDLPSSLPRGHSPAHRELQSWVTAALLWTMWFCCLLLC